MNYIMQNPEILRQVSEMIESIGKMRENPKFMQMLRQVRDTSAI